MRFVIAGAGGVGGVIGARLHRAGHDVLLLARGQHAAALSRGMTFVEPDVTSTLHVPVAASPEEVDLGSDDVLVLATKTQDALPLLDFFAAKAPGTPVVCATNGVEAERLAARRFDRVYGICVMLPATRLEPGVVVSNGVPYPGMLDVGRWPHGTDDVSDRTAEALRQSGFLSLSEERVMRWKHHKLLNNLGNAIEALTGGEGDDLYGPVRREGEEVLDAAGVDWVRIDEWRARRGSQVQIAPGTRSGGSTWQSLAKGSGSVEVDYLNGEIAYLARSVGRTAPLNETLQRLANSAARAGRTPGSTTSDELAAALGLT